MYEYPFLHHHHLLLLLPPKGSDLRCLFPFQFNEFSLMLSKQPLANAPYTLSSNWFKRTLYLWIFSSLVSIWVQKTLLKGIAARLHGDGCSAVSRCWDACFTTARWAPPRSTFNLTYSRFVHGAIILSTFPIAGKWSRECLERSLDCTYSV